MNLLAWHYHHRGQQDELQWWVVSVSKVCLTLGLCSVPSEDGVYSSTYRVISSQPKKNVNIRRHIPHVLHFQVLQHVSAA